MSRNGPRHLTIRCESGDFLILSRERKLASRRTHGVPAMLIIESVLTDFNPVKVRVVNRDRPLSDIGDVKKSIVTNLGDCRAGKH